MNVVAAGLKLKFTKKNTQKIKINYFIVYVITKKPQVILINYKIINKSSKRKKNIRIKTKGNKRKCSI